MDQGMTTMLSLGAIKAAMSLPNLLKLFSINPAKYESLINAGTATAASYSFQFLKIQQGKSVAGPTIKTFDCKRMLGPKYMGTAQFKTYTLSTTLTFEVGLKISWLGFDKTIPGLSETTTPFSTTINVAGRCKKCSS
jgi:hypothetical protein